MEYKKYEVTISYEGIEDKPFYSWGYSVDNIKEIEGITVGETNIKIVPT